MFGFKSKRYKKLERINEMLEMELRRLQAMKVSDMISRTTEKRVIPLHCSVTVNTMGYYNPENIIKYAEKEVLQKLADGIGEYVTFGIRKLDECDTNDMDGHQICVTKYEITGKVEVVEK